MPGNYVVKAKVVFSDGTMSETEYPLNVVLGLCPPIPSFDFYPQVPGTGEVVYFDAAGSMDLDGGSIAEYRWDFGDGNGEISSSPAVEHIYSIPGTYVVRLTVTDDDEQTNTITGLAFVAAKTVDIVILEITPKEHTVEVEFGLHIPSGAELSHLEIDFGDNAQHLTLNTFQGQATHSYQQSGTYTVTIRVTFLDGDIGEDNETVTVAVLSEGIWVTPNDRVGAYRAGENLSGEIAVRYTRPMPLTSVMRAYITGDQKDAISLANYLVQPGVGDYKQHRFTYQIRAVGDTRQLNSSSTNFSYTIRANGTCGGSYCSGAGCSCTCSPPYPCVWETQYSGSGAVGSLDGLKFIYNGESSITPPVNSNADTNWYEISNANVNVQTIMKAACGGETYSGRQTDSNGWIRRTLSTELTGVAGTSDREAYIEVFVGASLFPPRRFGNQGGIYKNGVYQAYDTGARWDGNSNGRGYVRILNYDATATYEIVYMPPSGSRLCAYAIAAINNSQPWERTLSEEHIVRYGTPFTKTYTESELKTMLNVPSCTGCQVNVYSYSVAKTQDSDSVVSLSGARNYTQQTFTITAEALTPMFSEEQAFKVDFSSFRNLVAPQQTGSHVLAFSIVNGNDTLATGSRNFVTCIDADGDGYCAGSDIGQDCNDLNPDVHPQTTEKCNGIDDNCDGATDETFWGTGSKLGNDCGAGSCSGYYVCGSNGGEVCSGNTTSSAEVCDNFLDDDCDGVTDEPECSCPQGQTEACGTDRGECKAGTKVCEFGSWSVCKGEVKSKDEICNRKDDDCDGIIDNIAGKTSLTETGCGCFKGAPPSQERCNGIDDDCDGRADEGLTCCEEGDSRSCSDQLGLCAEGYQECEDGKWGQCSVQPDDEVCWNDLDDNCNGEVDENCEGQPMPAPSGDGMIMWYLLAGLVIAAIAGTGIMYLTGKI